MRTSEGGPYETGLLFEGLGHLKVAATNSLRFFGGSWLDQFGAGGFGFFGLDVGFDFGTEAHAAVAIRIRLRVYHPRLAMRFVWLAPGDFGRHADGGFDGHTYLKRGRSNKEKSAARNIQGFGKVLAFIAGQINGAKAQGDAQTVAFEMSAFRRSHVKLRVQRGGARGHKNL